MVFNSGRSTSFDFGEPQAFFLTSMDDQSMNGELKLIFYKYCREKWGLFSDYWARILSGFRHIICLISDSSNPSAVIISK